MRPCDEGVRLAVCDRFILMQIPSDLRYSSDHEWAQTTGNVVRVGITDYAQDALGDCLLYTSDAADE